MKYILTFAISFLFFAVDLHAQTATVYGSVTDAANRKGVELVTVFVKETNTVAETNRRGRFEIDVPSGQVFNLLFTRVGYSEITREIQALDEGERLQISITLDNLSSDLEVIVQERKIEDAGAVREDVEELKLLPTTTGNLESVLPSIALGTSSGTGGELSSQYNVRGGNYDENLVYVNDFEVYRPQLIRAGQQEGLTFPNIDLVRDLSFSSGGFEAKYGDKLSSVLDIAYKRPDSLRASVGMSFLGGSAHIEGSFDVGEDDYKKLRYLVGARYKTTRYLLGSLDVQGEYTPNFADVQAYITYDLSRDLQLGILANYNYSEYNFTPRERNTAFGLINFALNLSSVFEGQERDDFTTGTGGVSLTYIPDRDRNPIFLKLLASRFQTSENERFDIIGRYSLAQIETGLGSDNFGEVTAELGAGTQQEFVRNYLFSTVTNVQHKGGIEWQLDRGDWDTESSHFLQWSVKFQNELVEDELNEWERLDSAGYSLQFDTASVQLFSVLKTRNELNSNRLTASLQDTYTWRKDSVGELKLTAGVRANYWNLNDELNITPRAQLLYKPLRTSRDISYRLAGGLYVQPPFYRELRRRDGTLNTGLRAQKSAHLVGGFTYDFSMGKKRKTPYRFILEAYYKRLWDLVSYDIDNVRIRYSGENDASGYVAGVDMRLNGEFVPGAESWFNLSFLRARENLTDVQHLQREIGMEEGVPIDDVPRPTDQFMTLSVYFQDYLRRNENFRMNLSIHVGTGLPYGLLDNNEIYRNTYRFSPYHRVDIGFAVQLWDESRRLNRPNHFLRFTRKSWLSLEIFNLLQVQNVASNTWIKTVFRQQYAIPNYLTSRRINLRLRMDF